MLRRGVDGWEGTTDQREERRREERKMTGTSFLTGKSFVDG